MGLRRRELRLSSGVGRLGMSNVPPAASHVILTATNGGGGNVLMTTDGPHRLKGSETITVSGMELVAYNGMFLPTIAWRTNTPTTFLLLGNYIGDSGGGRWD
jgi:hypothetical protein